MIVRFETTVREDRQAALARADVLLRRYGFVHKEERRYVRANRWGTGGGLRPRQVVATVDLAVGGDRISARLRTDPMRGPISALDRHVWRGEMDDLRAAIEGRPGPGLDRTREDYAAGVLTGSTALSILALFAFAALAFPSWAFFIVPLAVLLFVPYALLPFRMPRYPAPEEAPVELTNYPR